MAPMSTVTSSQVDSFLALRRIAVVGASDGHDSFGRTIVHELHRHGHEVVPVNPHVEQVDGLECRPSLAEVPGGVDGVVVAVPATAAVGVVQECIDLGIEHVWLFKGIGGPGALSDEAVALCEAHGIDVIPGACPLMFLEPVGVVHRLHRAYLHHHGEIAD